MRIKGTEYDADDDDVALLVAHSRVIPIPDSADAGRTYSTRELQSSPPTPRARRRTYASPSGPPALSPDDEN